MITGQLGISARYHLGQITNLTVRLERPPVTRLFVGQAPGRVLATVPLVYTLCAKAQTLAAAAALASAQGELPPVPEKPAELWLELLHEHLWRLLLDWPAAMGLNPAAEAFSRWRKARHGDDALAATLDILQGPLFGVPLAEASQPAPHTIAGQALKHLGAAPLPDDAHFCAGQWLDYLSGRSDTLPVQPQPDSVAAAYAGLLADTRHAAQALVAGLTYPLTSVGEKHQGVAQTLTARGLLTHGVRLENGKVAAYHVWAPTDRLFADAQSLSHLLHNSAWPNAEAARKGLELAVLALDPCVPYRVKCEG